MNFSSKFIQCFTQWDVDLPEWSDEAQVLCACTFGRGDDSCNKAMADHIAGRARERVLPYCVQGEIGKYMPRDLDGFITAESLDFHGRGYVATHHTVEEQVEGFLRPRGITKIHLEAQPEHAWRIVMYFRHFGVAVVSLCIRDKPYPEYSAQWWCCNSRRFVPYEIVARLTALMLGYI